MYDSLGRVLFAKQPEQGTNTVFVATDPISGNTGWSVKYSYDNNGNILTTVDARNVSITGSYDRFNRLTTRDYSDSTPDVEFFYDGIGLGSVPAFSKGKTTRVSSSVSETRNTSFDSMGRLLASQQITDGQTYAFGYTYNLSGALIEETYPSGRVVKNTLNADGELSQVQSRKCLDATPGTSGTCTNHAGFFTYADSFTYNSSGAVTKMQLGNGKWETASYNERLQITQIGLGVTSDDPNLLKLEFKYNTTGQTFTYDRYGNRRFDAANTTTLGTCAASICNMEINTSDNRLKKDQVGGTSVDYDYDANGALIKDFNGQRFGYDAESHQKEFFSASNQTTTPDATYHYGGEGKRVKKIVGTEVTIFVYDASGQLSAEAIRDPQSFNRYSYTLNSPYKFVDPLGLQSVGLTWCTTGSCVPCPASQNRCDGGGDSGSGG